MILEMLVVTWNPQLMLKLNDKDVEGDIGGVRKNGSILIACKINDVCKIYNQRFATLIDLAF
jgi:hypothetical protein